MISTRTFSISRGNLPEEQRKRGERGKVRFVVKHERVLEDVVQRDAERDHDKHVGEEGKRHQELELADLTDQQDGKHRQQDVDSHAPVQVGRRVDNLLQRAADEDYVDTACAKVRRHEAVVHEESGRKKILIFFFTKYSN